MSERWSIALHGGAGAIPADLAPETREAIEHALTRIASGAADALDRGTPAIDVVQQAVELLEDDPHFNAGLGAVLCSDGSHELEAAIMESGGSAGAACLLRTTRHPIAVARLVMDRTAHVMVAGPEAEALAKAQGLEQVENGWFLTPHRAAALRRVLEGAEDGSSHHATVGAVARDSSGSLAAATSTGGTTGKRPGRIGDTPLIGAGTWADERVAVSCTGRGEAFIRHAAAVQVAHRMHLAGADLDHAARETLATLGPAAGGLVAVDAEGRIAMPFTSAGMYRASTSSDGGIAVGIGPD